MSFVVAVDTATPALQRMAGILQGRGQGGKLVMRWGAVVRKEAMESAIGKGGRKFWRQVARSIKIVPQGDSAVEVKAEHVAAKQKQYGGPIRAKGKAAGGAEMLTIPISAEAENRRASDFALGGRVLFCKGNVLGYNEAGSMGRIVRFHPLFALVKSVEQEPDPWFPEDARVLNLGENEAERLLGKV